MLMYSVRGIPAVRALRQPLARPNRRRSIIITAPASIMKVRARAPRACARVLVAESAGVRRLVAFGGHRRRTGPDGKNGRRGGDGRDGGLQRGWLSRRTRCAPRPR